MMAQGCRIRLEAGIFLKYSEIEILPEGPLKDSLIQDLEQAWNRLAVCVLTKKMPFFHNVCHAKLVFHHQVHKPCNCIQVPEALPGNILNVQGYVSVAFQLL